jgi:CheY-like chemotaxis protein
LLQEAHDGKEAVNKTLEFSPDLVLMNVQMPAMNGLEATRLIREKVKGKQTPVIALISRDMKGEKEKCLEAGMNDFIATPVLEKTLKEVLIKWLGKDEEEENLHVNFDIIHIYTFEDEEFEKVFISLIIKSMNEALHNFYAYIEQKDLIAIKAASHKLRGAAATSGLIKVNFITSKLEALEDIEDNTINDLMNQLEAEIKVVNEILSNYLKTKANQ